MCPIESQTSQDPGLRSQDSGLRTTQFRTAPNLINLIHSVSRRLKTQDSGLKTQDSSVSQISSTRLTGPAPNSPFPPQKRRLSHRISKISSSSQDPGLTSQVSSVSRISRPPGSPLSASLSVIHCQLSIAVRPPARAWVPPHRQQPMATVIPDFRHPLSPNQPPRPRATLRKSTTCVVSKISSAAGWHSPPSSRRPPHPATLSIVHCQLSIAPPPPRPIGDRKLLITND